MKIPNYTGGVNNFSGGMPIIGEPESKAIIMGSGLEQCIKGSSVSEEDKEIHLKQLAEIINGPVPNDAWRNVGNYRGDQNK